MSKINNGGPAFPLTDWDTAAWPAGTPADFGTGITKRDFFAAHALVGIGNWTPGTSTALHDVDAIRRARAEWAYAQADAMLVSRGC